MTKITHKPGLTSTELAALWSSYISDTVARCLTSYLLKICEDEDVKPLLTTSLELSNKHLTEMKSIFERESFPVPAGFTDADVNLSAPPLFFDLFPLSYVYAMSRIGLSRYARCMANTAREDIRIYFQACLTSTSDLYNKSINLMLSKGIYDRPPLIPYPDHVSFITSKETFISKWFEPQRPLNVLELSEMFFNIERNYFAEILLLAFIQVTKDEKIKELLIKGKKLAREQIQFINNKLIEDDLMGTIMVNSEVTTSKESPFSDKLILSLVTTLNSTALTYLGNSLALSTRTDLVAEYSKLIIDVIQYGKDVTDEMIRRNWLEEPPHAPNRKELAMQ